MTKPRGNGHALDLFLSSLLLLLSSGHSLSSPRLFIPRPDAILFFLKLKYEHTSLVKPVDGSLLLIRYSPNPLVWHIEPCRISSHFPTHGPPPLHALALWQEFTFCNAFYCSALKLVNTTFYKIGVNSWWVPSPSGVQKLPMINLHLTHSVNIWR